MKKVNVRCNCGCHIATALLIVSPWVFVRGTDSGSKPVLAWSTYLGGSGHHVGDLGKKITTDGIGNIFVLGTTDSTDWLSGGFDTTIDLVGFAEAESFVAKLSPESEHKWSTVGLEGAGSDSDIAVDCQGNVLVALGGFGGGAAKISSSGQLLWSTRMWIDTHCIAVDHEDNVLIGAGLEFSGAGQKGTIVKLNTRGERVPSLYPTFDYGYGVTGIAVDAEGKIVVIVGGVVAKLSPEGRLLWSTNIVGTAECTGIAVDSVGNVLVTGWKADIGGGGRGVFVAKLSLDGNRLWFSKFGNRGWYDRGEGIAVDHKDNVLVTGFTDGGDWVSGGPDTGFAAGGTKRNWDAFVIKLDPTGTHLWSSFLGGDDNDHGYDVAVDKAGNVLVTGNTKSTGWVSGGFDTTYNGGGREAGDAFVVKIRESFPLGVSIVPTISSISVKGDIRLVFYGEDLGPAAFIVEATESLIQLGQWIEEKGAVITRESVDRYAAVIPRRGSMQFYRVRVKATP